MGSASHRAGGLRQPGRSVASARDGFKRSPKTDADGDPTVRNVIPWRDMERELKRRLAAKAARKAADEGADGPDGEYAIEPPPDSGVRPSASAFPVEHTPMRPLTYSMYTVSELDEMRPRQPSLVQTAPSEESASWAGWTDVGRSAVVLFSAFRAWLRTPKPRPKLADSCRVPFTALTADTRTALKRLPWKKLAVYGPITAVVMSLFLFAVLAVVDDDVKPTSTVRKPAAMAAAAVAAADAKAEAKPADPKPAEAKPAEPPPIEILDDATPAKRAAVATKKARPKKKPAEIFIP